MLTIDFSDVRRLQAKMEGAAKQVAFVTSFALNNAMKDAREAEYAEMRAVFDRPTRFTLNSIQVVPSSKTNLTAEIRMKEHGNLPAWKYLGPEVTGGARRHKGFERALIAKGILRSDEYVVPSENLQLDGFGNVKGGTYQQILSALGAQRDGLQNTTGRSKRRRRLVNRAFFVMRNRGQDGIYLRTGRFPVLVMLFVKAPTYTKRYPFYETAKKVIPAAFNKHFHEGWERFVLKGSR